jgi:SAM-dependent methyltransferase
MTRTAAQWDARYAGRELLWGSGPNSHFATAVAALSPGRALDLGCGDGRNAIWLAERGWDVTAVDFSSVALDRARRVAAGRGVTVDLRQEDLLTWVPPARRYDLVALLYVHLPSRDLAQLHARAAAAVAPGGVLIILGHDRRNLSQGHGGPQDPDVLLEPDLVRSQLAGLDVEVAETITRTVADTPPVTALDTYVRATRPAD